MQASHPAPVFRPARKSDCADIATLYAISSDGVANYVWTKLAADGEDILDVGRRRYENAQSLFSYRSCTLVELDGRVVGMLVAFPMHVDPAATETDPVLAPYSKLEADNSYYICGMALFPEYRGRGIGTELLDLAERQARAQGLDKTSLIVFEQNEGAYRLYQRSGYREVDRAAVVPHPLIHYSGDAVLMVKTL
ncbi:MAG: GNAT family N-acetyltransferase [Oceanospirillaceae bacterium]|nr:GNAT family N-acetyltransferase [Oceanospirillaceae bacterium]